VSGVKNGSEGGCDRCEGKDKRRKLAGRYRGGFIREASGSSSKRGEKAATFFHKDAAGGERKKGG